MSQNRLVKKVAQLKSEGSSYREKIICRENLFNTISFPDFDSLRGKSPATPVPGQKEQ